MLYLRMGHMSLDSLLLSHGWWPIPCKDKACSCLHQTEPSDIPCFGFPFSLKDEPFFFFFFTSKWIENEFVKISVTIDVFVTSIKTRRNFGFSFWYQLSPFVKGFTKTYNKANFPHKNMNSLKKYFSGAWTGMSCFWGGMNFTQNEYHPLLFIH